MLPQRVRRIAEHLWRRVFNSTVETGDFLFREGQYKIGDIDKGEWIPFGRNDIWGYREQYCWFKQSVTIPEEFAGKPVVYMIKPFPDEGWRGSAQQFIVFVNGRLVQGVDSNHTYLFLTQCAKGGESFDIALNAYCDDNDFKGPAQLRAYLQTVDTEVKDLYYDIMTAWEVAHVYGPDDTVRIDIVTALNDAVSLLEMNTPDYGVFIDSVKQARTYIDEKIYGKDSGIVTSAIGHTHIDVAWRWRLRQTRDKAGRSFSTVINLMKEYPDYKFMSPQAQLYDFVKQDYPELYADIKEMVKQGRWEPEGSMWVESDTNVISGESLVRQFLVGKRFFKQEFGVDNKIMWLPDVFGYSAALPQIMKLADINYFCTTKISWSEYNKFPYDTFLWKGIDGTSILSHFIPSTSTHNPNHNTTYTSMLHPDMIIGGWRRYSNKDLNRNVLCCFGHGDGGGGPTRENLEMGARMHKGIDGCPRTDSEFARSFFDRLDSEVKGSPRLPTWSGELYLEFHRGTYTAQSRNKRYNRKSEFLYHDAETLCETANILTGAKYPYDALLDGWKLILLNQFHDIIPGSSIAPVYEDSKKQYEELGKSGRDMVSGAIDAITAGVKTEGDSFVVYNTLGFTRDEVVITDCADDVSVIDCDGTVLPSQKTFDGKLAFLAKGVPAKGFKVFKLGKAQAGGKGCNVTETSAENKFYKLSFDADMNIASLLHKETGRSVAPEGASLGNLIAYDDRPHCYEAWEFKCYYDEKFWNINNVESSQLIENGPVRSVIKVARTFNSSTIAQYFVFYPHTARIDVLYDIDWKERNIALKADYPVDVNTNKATFDIQFGNLERTTHNNTIWDYAQFEVCGHKWADMSDNGFGFSVLNDCKYGWAVKEGHIKPTLLKCATDPNPYQDRERHTFTYALYPHSGPVASSNVVHEAYSLNAPLYCVRTGANSGLLGSSFSLVKTDKDNIIIETVKRAEDSDALIIRMYETWNTRTDCTLSLGIDVREIYECNLLEEKDSLLADGSSVSLTFKPFEIKTLKVIL